MAGCATCDSGWSSISAMSPTAKIRSWPATRRSCPTSIRPPRPCGSPQWDTAAGPDTPAAQTVTSLGNSSPFSRITRSSVISLILVFRYTSTPLRRSGHLDQPDVLVRPVHLGEGVVQGTQLGQGPGELHTGGPAAHDGEVDGLARALGVQQFQPVQDVIAQHDRVAAGVEADG